jgi:hypothetical protein
VNHAIHVAAVTQLRHDTNGRVYFDKKIREGKVLEGSDQGVEATYLRCRPQGPHRRRGNKPQRMNRVGPGGHRGTTLNPAWPACILTTGSSDKSLPGPDTNATTNRGTKPADHPDAPEKAFHLTQRGFDMGGAGGCSDSAVNDLLAHSWVLACRFISMEGARSRCQVFTGADSRCPIRTHG